MDEQATPTAAKDDRGTQSVRAELSREMVRLYKEQFGRGPTKAKSEFAGPDVLVCTLEDSFTPAERKLAEMGSTSACAIRGCIFSMRRRTPSSRPSRGS